MVVKQIVLLALGASALDNGLARTPPMGWMTWERFRCVKGFPGQGLPDVCAEDPSNCIDAKLITQHADILAQHEWRAAGYEYVNIDDCWSDMERTPNGTLAPNSTRFPAGMAALAEYVHGKGLKLGAYNDMGTKTCGGYPGECEDEVCSLPGFMDVDADTYAGWGLDSLKMDGCNSVHNASVLDPAYEHMGVALNHTGRPFLYSCSWPDYIRSAGLTVDYAATAAHCNMWRMYNDIQDSWDSVTGIVDWVGDNAPHNGMIEAAGPGNWNDPDSAFACDRATANTRAHTHTTNNTHARPPTQC
jgi:hypothetical protein